MEATKAGIKVARTAAERRMTYYNMRLLCMRDAICCIVPEEYFFVVDWKGRPRKGESRGYIYIYSQEEQGKSGIRNTGLITGRTVTVVECKTKDKGPHAEQRFPLEGRFVCVAQSVCEIHLLPSPCSTQQGQITMLIV